MNGEEDQREQATEENDGPDASDASVEATHLNSSTAEAEVEDLAQETWDRTDYPLRESSEDPRWAIRTVWIWIGLALASLVFIIVMTILGAIYD